MSGIIWSVIVFVAIGIFIIVSLYRILAVSRLPEHLRWELAPVPGDKAKSAYGGSRLEEPEWWRRRPRRSLAVQADYMAREILLLRGVWRHNRGLWPFSFSLHAGVYLFFLVLLLVIVDAFLIGFGAAAGGRGVLESVVSWLALAGYILGGLGALSLVARRLLDAGLRPFSTVSSYFNLALLAAVFSSGVYGWFRVPSFVADLGLFTRGLVAPAGTAAPPLAMALHVAFLLLFLAYLPLSDMFHFAAKFFTYHEVRWDDRPVTAAMERELSVQLSRPVRWSAAHVRADGRKAWTDVIDEKEKKP